MAYYSYKDLCYQIPSHIEERFVEENGCEPDGDPNYNGDYWTLAAMWVAELEAENARLIAEVQRLQSLIDEEWL